VTLAVYDVAGRLVSVLVDGEMPAGSHEAVWDGRGAGGAAAASGVYFYKLAAPEFSETRKMVLLR
jgi:flagellar hook assembly protein FlgD